ncbi:MAG: prephenate dehydratase [Clostridia bacterium]|nr:prephenate dehydratase [Clostridia bacterium]
MYDIETLRKQIDEIDSQLLPLFLGRMECSHNVAEYKRANNIPVLDKAREKQILETKMARVSDDLKIPVRDFFASIMKISRAAQAKKLLSYENHMEWLSGFESGNLTANPTVAYQGIPGANSETALIKFFGESTKKVNVMTFDEVLDAVECGDANYGVLPIENSSTGSISGAYDLLEKRDFYIVGEVAVDIEHCLVGLKGAELRDIRSVYSHEQGYMQCKNFFKNYPKMEFQPYYNTAIAAKMIAGLGDVSNAAIADRRTAELYGLDILADNISSIESNITRFIVVSKNGLVNPDCNKISILFTLPHESGSLCNVLSTFSDNGLNLVKIESRPSHEGNFEYLFFVDFEGNLQNPQIIDIMAEISVSTASFRILGNYRAS